MKILDTQRLSLRYLDTRDAPFILELVNQPAFLQYIGDRGVRNLDDAREYIQRATDSYAEHGFGLYLVELEARQVVTGLDRPNPGPGKFMSRSPANSTPSRSQK